MNMDCEVAVIGAGIIGASIAARLASAGISVALLDKGASAASGASGMSGGLVRLYDPDPLLMQLAAESIAAMHEGGFASTYGRALTHTGVLYRAAPQQQDVLSQAVAQYATADYPMQLLSARQLTDAGLAIGPSAERVTLFEPRACVGNVRLATSLLANVVRHNGVLLEHCTVNAIDCRGPHEVRLTLGDATLRCRALVIAAGSWSPQLVPGLQLQTRSIPLARVMAATDCRVPIIDAVTQSYVIPLGKQVLQTGCGFRDSAALPHELPPIDARNRLEARQRIEQLLGVTDSTLLDVLPGFDSYSLDGRPLLGFSADNSPLFVATGLCGLGFKFAPGIAQIAVQQLQRHLLEQAPDSSWAALSPRRAMSGADRTGGTPS